MTDPSTEMPDSHPPGAVEEHTPVMRKRHVGGYWSVDECRWVGGIEVPVHADVVPEAAQAPVVDVPDQRPVVVPDAVRI